MSGRLLPALAVVAALATAATLPAALGAGTSTMSSSAGQTSATAPTRELDRRTDSRDVRWRWPVDPPVVVLREFEWSRPDWRPGHRGVDLAASHNALVRAPASGEVAFAGWVVDRGVLTIDHGDLTSSFEPVTALVEPGQMVTQGETIAQVAGSEHCGEETCLHWGVREGEDYLDPATLVAPRRRAVLLE